MVARWTLIAGAALALSACLDDEPCDPGQVFENNICIQINDAPRTMPEGGMGGAGAPDFGTLCLDDVNHSDCADPAPYCAFRPGESVGICTIDGCTADPSLCPPGWSCFDISVFSPELPSICTEDN